MPKPVSGQDDIVRKETETEVSESGEEKEMPPEKKLMQIVISAGLLLAAFIITRVIRGIPLWGQLLIFLLPYLLAGFDVIGEAVEKAGEGEIFSEDLLMCIATAGALLIGFIPGGKAEFAEAVFVMLFFQIGELFETIAEGRSERAITGLMDIRPDMANIERDGEIVSVSADSVSIGDTVVVRPGEKIPVDGIVASGSSSLDTVALTGESSPRAARPGTEVYSGCVNLQSPLYIRAEKTAGQSTASKILELVKTSGEKKSKSERFITKFARVYTPVVVGAAVVTSLVPPLVSGHFVSNFAEWLLRALTFLIVSCPCALVISVPLAFFGGIGRASKNGILVKGSSFIDALSRADIAVFDKTGTLTKGVFKVTLVHPMENEKKDTVLSVSGDELLHLAAHVERYSTHPIATSLKEAYGRDREKDDGCQVSDVKEIAGQGIEAVVNGRKVAVGNEKMMRNTGADFKPCSEPGTIIHVAVDGKYAGHIHIDDVEKEDALTAVSDLKAVGVRKTVMLTGDLDSTAKRVAKDLHIDEFRSELLPADKVDEVTKLLDERKNGGSLIFAGDGINDAPVLARADVGIAMGAMGSDAAIEAADVVLMDDKPSKIAAAIRLAKRTKRIATENIVFAIAVKIFILMLAAIGRCPMWLAVFGDTGVMILCVLNSARLLGWGKYDWRKKYGM